MRSLTPAYRLNKLNSESAELEKEITRYNQRYKELRENREVDTAEKREELRTLAELMQIRSERLLELKRQEQAILHHNYATVS